MYSEFIKGVGVAKLTSATCNQTHESNITKDKDAQQILGYVYILSKMKRYNDL